MDNNWIASIPILGKILMAQQGGVSFWEALPILQTGLIACIICSIICAFIGVHVILRRIVFVSASISQVSSLGLASALLLMTFFKQANIEEKMDTASMLSIPGLLAVIAAIIASAFFALRNREQRLTRESIIGVAYVLPSAIVLLILDRLSTETHMIDNILFGNTVFVAPAQLKVLVAVAVIILLTHLLLFKEFIAVAFDHDSSKAAGMPVTIYEQIFYLTLALIISLAIGSIGILPVSGFMIMPAATALLLTTRLKPAFIISVIIGIISSTTGFYLSFLYSLPTGPSMLGVTGIILLFAAIYNFFTNR